MSHLSPPRAWAEIDLTAIQSNIKIAQTRSNCQVMAVLKAGAYGHGLETVGKYLDDLGLAFFGVANVSEARRLQEQGIKTRLYLLGATFPEEREEIVLNDWTPCISSIEEAQHFHSIANLQNKELTAHLAIDTGMGRGGFLPEDSIEATESILKLDRLNIEGIGSHMPSPDEDREFTEKQIELFRGVVAKLNSTIRPKFIHLANSAGLLGYSTSVCNMVRPGLMMYGISPLSEHQHRLKTTMFLKSKVTIIRDIPAGHGISYGRTFITSRPSRIATIGIGYGDGYPRSLSGKEVHVAIEGQLAPIVGRVTMDQIMVDITDLPDTKLGAEVELFGSGIIASELAEKAGTITWELFTGITPRVSRIYKK